MQDIYRNKDWLREQYNVKGRKVEDIAAECGVSKAVIKKYLYQYGIGRKVPELKYWQSKDWLIQNYSATDIQVRDLAAKIGVQHTQLYEYIKKYGITKGHYSNVDYDKLNDPEWLKNEYIVKNRTMQDIQRELRCTSSTLYARLSKFGLTRLKDETKILKKIDESVIDFQIPEFCYIAGLMQVDGHIVRGTKNVVLQMSEIQAGKLVENIHKFLKAQKPLTYFEAEQHFGDKYTTKSKFVKLDITQHKLVEALNSFGMYHLKSEETRFPSDICNWSEDCQSMFIRGMMDGDGTSEYGNRIAQFFRQQSYGTVCGLWKFLNDKFGMQTSVKPFETTNGVQMWYIYLNKDKTYDLFKWMYTGYQDFRLDYKYHKFIEGCKNHGIY